MSPEPQQTNRPTARDFFIHSLLVRIHLVIEMISWTGLAPWEFEFRVKGSGFGV